MADVVLCDDFLVRPFSTDELNLRLKRLLENTKSTLLKAGDLYVDPEIARVWRESTEGDKVGKQEIVLTRLEFKLLVFLFRNRGYLISYDGLLSAIWGSDWDEENRDMVKATIKRLLYNNRTRPLLPEIYRLLMGKRLPFGKRGRIIRINNIIESRAER